MGEGEGENDICEKERERMIYGSRICVEESGGI